jgi:exopolysaccharide biosynthesis polyprenyl glycosylphosphotransferase
MRPVSTRWFVFRVLLIVADAGFVKLGLWLAYWARFLSPWFPTGVNPGRGVYDTFEWLAVGVWTILFASTGAYGRINLFASDEFLRVAKGVFLGWVVVLAGVFLSHRGDLSRLSLGLGAGAGLLLVFLGRQALKTLYVFFLRRWGSRRGILVVGGGPLAQTIRRVLARHPDVTVFASQARDPGTLRELIARHRVREVYLGETGLSHAVMVAMSETADEAGVIFRIVPDVLELRMGEVVYDDSSGLPTYQIKSVALHGWTYFYKRLFDVVIGLVIALAGAVPFLAVALLIKLDSPGPVFFRQKRVGLRGRTFPLIKFRTMVADAERQKEELRGRNERAGPVFKIKGDPRVTWVGKWLRRFSVDEFPQILNILRGDMSLVGPRPPLPEEVALYPEGARKRLNVLPGLTGLWQVSGRAKLTFEEMVELDIFYIEHWSPGMDLKILFRTFPAVFRARGAY